MTECNHSECSVLYIASFNHCHRGGNGTPLQYSCLEIPWTEEPGRLRSVGSLGVRHDWVTSLSLFTVMHRRRKWQPSPVFLPGESQGWGAWWAAVYGVAQSRTRLKRLSRNHHYVCEIHVTKCTNSWLFLLLCNSMLYGYTTFYLSIFSCCMWAISNFWPLWRMSSSTKSFPWLWF